MGGEVSDWLRVIDTLDVPTVIVMLTLGGWKVITILHKIEQRLALREQAERAMVRELVTHIERDEKTHERIYSELKEIRSAR